ncbi:hypothetical protein [uncultured Paraglaciecola sp.]|uniref:hypothetical protein n=1 Tax=uncultured Paraglaciecola sp. TaxID=1765024 RepID=UPI00261D71F4|nr:hypothetical protein [uncultured Paraglaciecola sp.]
MSKVTQVSDNSLLPSLLLVLFIGLKLTGFIDWSWWWVMSPLWIPIVAAVVILIFYGLYLAMRSARQR